MADVSRDRAVDYRYDAVGIGLAAATRKDVTLI
jgi:hypothetical protein